MPRLKLRLYTDGKIRLWYEYLPGKFIWRYYGRIHRGSIIRSMQKAPEGN